MEKELISKGIPVILLLVLGAIEAFGGLYFNDKRTRNDFTIELISLITLPILIQPLIFLTTIWGMNRYFSGFENYFLETVFLVAHSCLSPF